MRCKILHNNLHFLVAPLRKHALRMLDIGSLLLGHAHLGSVRGVRHPFGRGARGCLLEHAVDLLKGEALGFGDEQVGVDDAEDAKGAPEEEDLGAEVDAAVIGGG